MDVSNWRVDTDVMAIGAREKEVLIDPDTGRRAFFKFPRNDTAEHWTEKISSELASIIGYSCQTVEIASYNGVKGALCYNFLGNDEELTHGSELLYGTYDDSKARDLRLHTIERIRNHISVSPYEVFGEFLVIPAFDALIGNTDRHAGNWGVIYNITSSEYRMAPLFDNSSSLGWQFIDSEHIQRKLGNSVQWDNFINNKCLSAVRWSESRINHFDFVKILIKEFPAMIDILSKMTMLTDSVIESKVDGVDDGSMPAPFKTLVIRIIKSRRDVLLKLVG